APCPLSPSDANSSSGLAISVFKAALSWAVDDIRNIDRRLVAGRIPLRRTGAAERPARLAVDRERYRHQAARGEGLVVDRHRLQCIGIGIAEGGDDAGAGVVDDDQAARIRSDVDPCHRRRAAGTVPFGARRTMRLAESRLAARNGGRYGI